MKKALTSPDRPVAVGYIRVSSRKQADEGGSLEAQREAVIREAVLSGFGLTEVYADEGISGGKGLDARPGLAAAVREVEEGRAQAVIVAHTDRLARDTDLAGYLRIRVKQAGGRVIAIGEAKDDPIRAAVDRMLAELERVRGSQRMKFFHAARKAKGLRAGPAPYGFRTGADGRLMPEQSETKIVHRIEVLRVSGASLRAIAAELNRDAVPTRAGRGWNPMIVSLILRRRVRQRLADALTAFKPDAPSYAHGLVDELVDRVGQNIPPDRIREDLATVDRWTNGLDSAAAIELINAKHAFLMELAGAEQ